MCFFLGRARQGSQHLSNKWNLFMEEALLMKIRHDIKRIWLQMYVTALWFSLERWWNWAFHTRLVKKALSINSITTKFLLKDESLKTKSELIMNGVRIDHERIKIIEKFWQAPGVRKCFGRRNEFQLTDSAGYFLDNARRITDDDFEPSDTVKL